MTSPTLTDLLAEAKALSAKADNLYCVYVEQCRRSECLGHEQKLKDGTFGKAELRAHIRAAQILGAHIATKEAVNVLPQLLAWEKQARELIANKRSYVAAQNCGCGECRAIIVFCKEVEALLGPAAGEGR